MPISRDWSRSPRICSTTPNPRDGAEICVRAVILAVAATVVQISTLVVAAHSYGGLIADLLARTHPEMVSGLVLVDPTSQFLPTVGNAAPQTKYIRPTPCSPTRWAP